MMTHPTDHAARAMISVTGNDRVSFLQGILTQDVSKLNDEKIQFAAMLSPQGKILHDMFLVAVDNAILIDTQDAYKDTLLKRLAMYRLRAKVVIGEIASDDARLAALPALPDPRHPHLPPRDYAGQRSSKAADYSALGIPELGRDFAPDEIVALDAGYDLLHAISFSKGCYVGQEVTARMHYKQIARRGFFILTHATLPTRLALLRFADVHGAESDEYHPVVTVDNIIFNAHLPAWMQPKLRQFKTNISTQ